MRGSMKGAGGLRSTRMLLLDALNVLPLFAVAVAGLAGRRLRRIAPRASPPDIELTPRLDP